MLTTRVTWTIASQHQATLSSTKVARLHGEVGHKMKVKIKKIHELCRIIAGKVNI
jgi:hypothetical protein